MGAGRVLEDQSGGLDAEVLGAWVDLGGGAWHWSSGSSGVLGGL